MYAHARVNVRLSQTILFIVCLPILAVAIALLARSHPAPATPEPVNTFQGQQQARQELRDRWSATTANERLVACSQYQADRTGFVLGQFIGADGVQKNPFMTRQLVNDFYNEVCTR